MLETASVFDVMAVDDFDRRVASRQALALARTRLDNTLGRFLRGAVTKEEWEARFAACEDEFALHVAEACDEVGHDHPEHVAKVLAEDYLRHRRWQPQAATKREADEATDPNQLLNDPAAMASLESFVPQGMPQVPQPHDPNASPVMPGLTPQAMGQLESFVPHGMPSVLQPPKTIAPGVTPEELKKQGVPNMSFLGQEIGEKVDPGEEQDSNDGKGVLEPHQDDEDVKAPKIKSSAEEGNTDLGGPEPKIDKRLWTPENPGDPKVDDGQWPTVRKDVAEPVGPPNNEHELAEHEGHGVEHQSLPNNSGDAGFDAGGPGPAPHTDTWSGTGDLASPVTDAALV